MKLWEIQLQLDKLFVITETGEAVDEETGEVFDAGYLDGLQMERNDKLRNLSLLIKDINGDIDKADKELKRLKAVKKTLENRQDSLKGYVANILQGEKWEADDFSAKIGWRMSRDVVTVDDVKQIPIAYFKTPQTESNLNKTAVKEAIKAGAKIEGVHLQDNNNIQIK